MPDWNPDYRSVRDETVVIDQFEGGVDDYSTLHYGAIDESFTNWGGIMWGCPPKWHARDLVQVPWTRTPFGIPDASYDEGATGPNGYGPRNRGALSIAPGLYDVEFFAKWSMTTAPRNTDTHGDWAATMELNVGQWESAANPLAPGSMPIDLPPSDGTDQQWFETTINRTFDTRNLGENVLYCAVGIRGPSMWQRILHDTWGSRLTLTRHSDYVPVPPEGLVAGPIRYGSLRRERPR